MLVSISKFISVLLLVIAVCVALPYRQNRDETESNGCDLSCPYIYTPVCGTDGKINRVFASPCVMERQSCLEQKG